MSKIFISYRRNDAPTAAEWIYEVVVAAFGTDRVLMDVEDIPPGADFESMIHAFLDECDIMLVIIGRHWLDIRDETTGRRRLEDPSDWVRIEIEEAVRRDLRIIPLLVEDARMPVVSDLPEPEPNTRNYLRAFLRCNARRLEVSGFVAGARRLIPHLKDALEEARTRRMADQSAEHRRLMGQRRRELQLMLEEERDGLSDLSEEQIARREELAWWDLIKENPSIGDLRDHLARFPSGSLAEKVLNRLDAMVWTETDSSDRAAIVAYLDEFPHGQCANEARAALTSLDTRIKRAVQRRRLMRHALPVASVVSIFLALSVVFVTAGRQAKVLVAEALPPASRITDWSALSPGSVGNDCEICPPMVVIPAGSFFMGSPNAEPGRDKDEGPRREVAIAPFALSRTEITFEQWDACVADGFCRTIIDDNGWGRGRQPVINVSWNDITGGTNARRGFIAWMNSKVRGTPYRLPTEAEWEYAARAGTSQAYAWGPQDPICKTRAQNNANFGRDRCFNRALAVGIFRPNGWGLYDMHGNVWEWVQDCWHASYRGAPSDGTAWMRLGEGVCSEAVVRGGGWIDAAPALRAASRKDMPRSYRYTHLGFRLARNLP